MSDLQWTILTKDGAYGHTALKPCKECFDIRVGE